MSFKKIAFPLLSLLATFEANALPQSAAVVSGQAVVHENDKTVNVEQYTNTANIDWQSFNLASDETFKVHAVNNSDLTINKVIGDDVSNISGKIESNARVVLLNEAGIYFSDNLKIDAPALIASTLSLSNVDLTGSEYKLSALDGKLFSSYGDITVDGKLEHAGSLAFFAPKINLNGNIIASRQQFVAGSNNSTVVSFTDDNLISFTINNESSTEVEDGEM